MTAATLAGPLAFVLLAGLMCWHIATVKGRWWVKLSFIILVPSFGLLLWAGIASHLGRATHDDLPKKALLTGIDIKEPSAEGADDGAIWLMVVSLDAPSDPPILGYRPTRGEPRMHVLPYTKELHELLEAARARMAEGSPVVLERATGDPSAEDGKPGMSFSRQQGDYKVYDLPPPALPKKNAQ